MEDTLETPTPSTIRQKKLKLKHHENFGDKVLALIIGRSGCGKTWTLFDILTTPNFLDYNNLIILKAKCNI